MSLDVPHRYESQIQQIAQAQDISADEALARIIQAGVEHFQPRVATRPRVSYASLFAMAEGPGTHKTREDVDRYISELRAEW